MARPNKATQAKRGRELKKQDKRKEKAERRADRKQERTDMPRRAQGGEDPDLIGIFPGPQKPIE